SSLRVLGGGRDAGLDPEERPVKTRVGLRAEELAVQIDADLEARVAGHDLNRGRAADRVPYDPDVFEVEVAGEGRVWFELRESAQLVEREAAVGRADADQALEGRMRRWPHHVRVRGLPDDLPSGEHRDRGLVRHAQGDDDIAAAGEVGAERRIHLAWDRQTR